MQDSQDILTSYLIPTVVEQSSRGERALTFTQDFYVTV